MANPEPSRGRALLTILLLLAAFASLAAWAYLRRSAPAAAAEPIDVPADFGGAVVPADLARVADAARGGALNAMNLALELGNRGPRPSFVIGEEIRLTARAGEPSRCAVVHRNARGTFRLFHPERGESFPLSPSQRWDSGALRITEPAGSESFLLICRSEGAASVDLRAALERPRDEWRRVFSAVRADYDVTR